MRLTSYKPAQPNPGEDIHHTVVSCEEEEELEDEKLEEDD